MQPARETNNRIVPLRQNQGNSSGSHPAIPISQARRARQIRIGKILLAAKLVSPECLQEALTIAQELQQPIGKVLTSTQQITDLDLQSALLAQSMMAEGLIEEHIAMESLKLAANECIAFGLALEVVQQLSDNKTPIAADLEEMLVSSGMISIATLDEAKKFSYETNLSLGSSLMSMRAIVFAHLNFVFECINLVGAGRITKANAIKALTDIKRENIDLSQALQKQKISPRNTQSKLKLGDLLTAGSVISEKDNLTAIEQAMTEKRLVGEILVSAGLLSEELLTDALNMQALVVKGVLAKEEAAYVLRQVVSDKKDITRVLRDRKSLHDDASSAGHALDLLIKAKLIKCEVVPQAMQRQQRYEMDALKALVASDLLSGNLYEASIESARRFIAGEWTQQEAVSVLLHCDLLQCDIRIAARELGLESKQQSKVREEVTQVLPQIEEPKEQRVPSWKSSFELKLAIIALIASIGGGVGVMMIFPDFLGGYCVCGVLLVLGLAFWALGKIWEDRVKEKKIELQKQEEAAKQQVSRLAKIRAKDGI